LGFLSAWNFGVWVLNDLESLFWHVSITLPVDVCYGEQWPMTVPGRLGDGANGRFVALQFEKSGFG
jgi:hypothetical protein